MLESIVGSILNRFLGEYFENFSSANVNVGFWNGDAKIENLRMTENALKTALNLPLAVRNGHLQMLQLAIPWKNLGGEPTIMKLDGLKVEAIVTESVEHSAEDELRSKQKLLDYIETKLDAEAVVETTSSNSEAYTNKVLKNLQVEIQNIEIKIIDAQLGSSIGLYLGSLTLKTADTEWREVGVMDHTAEEARMFKIAKLENLGLFINSDTDTEPQYILEPLTILAHLQHNLRPNDNELRGDASINLQSIGLRLTSSQFRFITSSIEKLERIRRNAKFRKGRPSLSTKEDPKAWWRYAGNTVIQMYNIKEKAKLFNRKYITEYCQNRKTYRELFKQKLQGTRTSQSDIDALESALDIPTVIELRQKARSLVKKQTNAQQSSWFGGWFGAAAQEDHTGNLEIDENDRSRIQSILDGVDLSKSKDPPGVTRYQLQVSLPLLKIQLGEILTLSLEEAFFTFRTTPGCKSEMLQVKFNRLLVDSHLAKSPIVTTNTADGGEFFSFTFTTNPFTEDTFEKIADRLLVVKSSGIEVKYDDDAARALSSFFHVGDRMNEVRQVIQDEYIQRYEQSRAGMSHIISTRKLFLIDIDLKAPRVEIPGPEGQCLEMNFGRLVVESRRAKVTSLSEFDQSRYSIDQLQEMVYASYDVKLVDLKISVQKRKTLADQELAPVREILSPLSINFEFQRLDSKAQATVELAKFKIKGQLDMLKLNFSDYRMAQVSIIMSTIRRAWRAHRRIQEDIIDVELPDAPIYIPNEENRPGVDAIEIAESYSNIQLTRIASTTSNEEFFDANDESFTTLDSLPISHASSSLADSAAKLKLSFALNMIHIQLDRETPSILIADGQIRKVEFTLKQTKFTTDIDGQFEAVNLLYKPDCEEESLNLISLGAPNQPAVEMTYGENRLLTIPETDVRFETASVRASIDPQAINEVSGFITTIFNAANGTDSSIDTRGNSLLSRESSNTLTSMDLPDLNDSSESVMNIVICSRKFDIDLFSKQKLIAQLYLNNGEVGFVTRENQTVVKITVGGVKVVDPNALNPLYRNVLTVVDSASTFFDMTITLYDVDLKQDANNIEAIQGSIYLRTGCIKLIFFQKWIDYLAFYYPEEFATGPVDWDFIKSKDGSFLMSKYLMDVEIKDPIVIIPASTTHNFGFRGDVRNIKIRNEFRTITTTGHKFHPLFNKMTIDIEDLCLYNMPNYNASSTKLSSIPILDESLTIFVESSAGWEFYKDDPGLIVDIDIKNATAHLNQEDMVALWCVLNGNIWIRYDPKAEELIELNSRRTGRFLSMLQPDEASLDESTSVQDDSFEEHEVHIDMIANVNIKTLAAKVYVKDELYSSLIAQDISVVFTSKTNLITYQDIIIQDILLYDEREENKNISGESNCLLQKQEGIPDPVITLKVQNFTKPAKQITDMDVKSMRMVLIMDFILTLKAIFADTMYEPVVMECTPKTQNLDVHQIHAHMQFQAKMDRPHIILMSDLKNAQDSSCIKMSADLRVVYIASLTEQNLDVCIDQPQIYSVSFKNSFGNDEVYFGHKILNSEVNIAFNQLTSPRSNMINIKCPELDITFNPEAVNTLFLSYQVAMGPEEEPPEPEKKKICLDVQQTIDPKELWFVPNALGSDVDSDLSLEMERMRREETMDEMFTMVIPDLTIRLESLMSSSMGVAESQVVPLLVLNSSLDTELRNWSSEMFADLSMKLDAEIYHESRPGYEPFIEQAESNLNLPDSKLVPFGVKLKYKTSTASERSYLPDDDDGYAHVENNAKQKLVISSDVPLNMNVSSEGVDVLNHLATVYGHSLSDAAKGTLADVPKKRRTKLHNSEVKAPIIVINETGNDLILSTKDWIEFDPNQAKTDIRRNSLTRIKGKKPTDIKLHPVPRGSPRPEMMSFSIPSSTPRYFQFGRHIHVRSLSAYMIGLSPVGFSQRQIDVSSLQENAYIFVANNNPAFKVILVVKVEGVTGARKITIQTSVTISNEIPFPLELINGAQARWQVNDETRSAPMPIRMMNSACIFDVTFADPDVSVADNPIVYSTKTSFSTRLQLSVKHESTIHHMTAQVKMIPYKRSSLYKVHIRFCPVFSLTNWLPYPISCTVNSKFQKEKNVIIDSGRLMPFMSWSQDCAIVIEFAVRNSGIKYTSEKYMLPRSIDKRETSMLKFSRLDPSGTSKECLLKKQITIDAHEHKMEVFAPYWIINATDLDLELRPVNNIGRDSDVLKQLHCDPLMILPTKHNEMNISVLKSNKSNKTHINTIGHMGTVFCPPSNQDRQSYLLGIKIEQTSFALTTLVKLTPFYYLVNRTDEELEVREVFEGMIELDRKSQWIPLDPKSKIPFWPLDSRYSKLLVRKARSQFISEKISYHSQDQGILLNMGDVEGLYSEVSHNDNECLITFTSYFKGAAAFDIINLTGFAIHYKQETPLSKYAHLYPAHRILYTWRYPSESKSLELRIDGKEAAKCSIRETGQDAMMVRTLRISGAQIFVIPVFIGTQRTVVITQDQFHKNRLLHVDKQVIEKENQIQLRGIGLSLVDSIRREEVAFISIKGTGGIWYQQREGSRKWRECSPELTWELESRWRQNSKTRRSNSRSDGFRCGNYQVDLGQQTMVCNGKNWTLNRTERQAVDIRYLETESSSSLELSLQSVQIDNTSPAPKWPVVFARVPPKQSVAAVEVADNVAMVYVSIVKDKSHDSNITKYKMFHVLLQECFLQVEVDFVAKVLQAFAENSKRGKKLKTESFRLFMEDLDYASNPVSAEKIVASSISFFEHMHLSPIRMHFRFSLQYGAEENILEDLNLLHKLQNLGIGQVAKGDVSLQLSFFQTEYEYFSDNIIRERIIAHYRFQVIQQLYKFLLGIELLGNPAKVAVDMFSGVKDFFYEPYQGITQSGEAFIEGIGSGTSKLFSGVVGGVTGGFSRLTHNIGSVSAAVTFDKEYQNKRTADNVNNVKGVKEGVARAGEKFFGGLFGGIAGVVEKPISGARQEGAAGFFKGVGKGVTGLVAKPITGIVDAASTTLAGVHSQLETKVQVDRIRYPRVVDEGRLQPYRRRLAYAQHCLRSLQDEEIALETPLGLGYSDNERIIIVVTSKSICVIDTRTTTGRLKAEFIQDVANANIIYSGDRGQAIIQLRDRQGQIRMIKVRALADLEHLKRAISKNKEISARQEFDTMF